MHGSPVGRQSNARPCMLSSSLAIMSLCKTRYALLECSEGSSCQRGSEEISFVEGQKAFQVAPLLLQTALSANGPHNEKAARSSSAFCPLHRMLFDNKLASSGNFKVRKATSAASLRVLLSR
eukprot:768201-Hanusia_phi.AAC.2